MPRTLFDAHRRTIDYIRISLTDRCNFRCLYCMPPEGEDLVPHAEILTYEELLRLVRIFTGMGLSSYKITGGEPLCRKGAVDFIQALKATPGVRQVTLTSNGAFLAPHIERLAAIGIDGINISLDTLRPELYRRITRSRQSPEPVLHSLELAKKLGVRIKINVVPLKGWNEAELPELTAFALARDCHIRFIELMPLGLGAAYSGVPQNDIRRMVEKRFGALSPLKTRISNGPAENFSVAGHAGSVGFISAMSRKFCASCNRVRLTAAGFLKTCLHFDVGVELKPLLRGGASDAELEAAAKAAVHRKPLAHEFENPSANGKNGRFLMHSLGG